jgi:hypothetical protein
MLVTVIINLFPGKGPTIFRNIPVDDALRMISHYTNYRLVFNLPVDPIWESDYR